MSRADAQVQDERVYTSLIEHLFDDYHQSQQGKKQLHSEIVRTRPEAAQLGQELLQEQKQMRKTEANPSAFLGLRQKRLSRPFVWYQLLRQAFGL